MYQALYRKWRPHTFDDVVGQEHITQTLKRQVRSGRLSHAYLFTGTRGTGKTTCAKILARAVNCQDPQDGNPCNRCPACLGIDSGAVLDVLELDAASNNRVDDIRAILDEAVYTPASVGKRVYIVDEVHMLSPQAFNALLQILEEPPAHLMFILATTEIYKVPATIKSRCQQFSFKRIPAQQIADRLHFVAGQEGMELTQDGGALLARLADGGMRDALSLLDQCAGAGGQIDERRVQEILGLAGNLETAALLETVAEGDAAGALERLERLYTGGKEMEALAGELSALVRDLLVRKTAPDAAPSLMTGGYDEATLRRLAGRLERPRLVHLLRVLQETAGALLRSANRRTDMELCLVTLCDPALDPSPAALSARVARLEQGLAPAVGADGRAADPAPKQPVPPEPAPTSASQAPVLAASAPKVEGAPESAPAAGPAPTTPIPSGEVRSWPGWEALCRQLKGVLDVSDFVFLGNPAMVKGAWDGHTLTLWAANEFLQGRVSAPPVAEAVAQVAGQLMGGPVRLAVRIGSPPQERMETPARQEPDALEAFLSGSQGNVIVD